ncbi:MAG TPA: SpoIIE family protein phosphatase [Spirochaetota bacterium]|nr:SpoIIE family protein phosphatase [Spirochaetota bacterium]HPH01932.1 SpoIIE family protein phosphatase [Spirochaetota bacterium]
MGTNGDQDRLSAYKLYSLVNISKKINSLLEINALLELIMESCKTLLNAEASSLMLVNEEKQVLTFNIISGKGEELRTMEVPIGKGIAGIVAQSGEPLIINDAQNDPRFFKEADKKTNMVTSSIVCVPMTTNKRVIGVLEAINALDRDGFNDDDLLLLMALAEQAAISITNRKLYDRIKARAEELSAMYEIGQLAMSHGSPERILQESLEIVSRVMGCKRTSILMHDASDDTLRVKASIGFEGDVSGQIKVTPENEISYQVFHTLKFIYTENVDTDPRFGRNKRFRYTTRSFVSVPMQTKERPIGVLNVTDKQDGGHFDAHDVRLLQTIANQISEVHENIRLYNEERVKLKLEKELEVTRRLQEAIFPKSFPSIPGVTMFACNKPASEVGGDFYDFFHSTEDPGQFTAVIADVSGKSVPAALFMAISRSILRAQAVSQEKPDPAALFESANRLIIADSDSAMFVTSFMLHCDINARKAVYSNAGHNDPILLRRGRDHCIQLHTRGKPLAVMPDSVYQNSVLDIEPGDIIVMYTDGIVEANNMLEQEFGMDRFEEEILACRHLPADAMARHILQRVNAFAAETPQFDDMTLFIFKFELEPNLHA